MSHELFNYPNVVGFGMGMKRVAGERLDERARVVLVRRKVPMAALMEDEIIPSEIDGIQTDVFEVGHLRALQARTEQHRPAPGGVSIGHKDITAGTLGVVVANEDGHPLILSNNHVLAASNNGWLGDPIYQPGPIDGGGPEDVIALLTAYQRIRFDNEPGDCSVAERVASAANTAARWVGSSHRLESRKQQTVANVMDAAIASPASPSAVDKSIIGLGGEIHGIQPASLGMLVRKSGRTTGLTSGVVQVIDAVVQVSYGSGLVATFKDQIITDDMSRGGDSGSLTVSNDNPPRAVGLLFGGSDRVTIHSPIFAIMKRFNLFWL